VNLTGFPRRTLRGDRDIYRIHRYDRFAWWFSSDGSGRFDPVGTSMGACYLAEKPLGAWVEVFRRGMLIAEVEVQVRRLGAITLGRDLRLANLASRRALQFGVTASLGADQDYAASQAFARAALEYGFDGLRYLVRHDPAQQLYGIALFSDAGAAVDDGNWPPARSTEIPEIIIESACRRFGYRILPTP